jgi:predicted nucleic acid-binding protein
MAALRCLIDSMVFDAIAADRQTLDLVDLLTRAGDLELLAAAETMREVDATPDRTHRRALQRVRVLVVPPAAGHDDRARRILRESRGVSDEDAQIALAAAEHGVPLVTEDRELREAMAAALPGTPRWRWAELQAQLEPLAAGTHHVRRRP